MYNGISRTEERKKERKKKKKEEESIRHLKLQRDFFFSVPICSRP